MCARLRVAVIVLAAVLCAIVADLNAAGTATVTTADMGGNVTKYTVAWTSTAGGAVSGNAFQIRRGELVQVKVIPGSGGTQPTDLYDLTIEDADGVDLLAGAAANLSNSESAIFIWPLSYLDNTVDVVIANAGSAKTGTVILWIR